MLSTCRVHKGVDKHESGVSLLNLTPTMDATDDIPQYDVYCTKPFEANPDVSGIGVSTYIAQVDQTWPSNLIIRCFQILIASLGQAILAFAFSTVIDFLRRFAPNNTQLRERLEVLRLGIITGWVTMGFAMAIAAFSQWRTLSMFHWSLCSLLAATIPTLCPNCIDPINWQSKRLKIIYFMAYKMLRVATFSYLIYRSLGPWSNNPGRCFITMMGTTGGPIEGRMFAVLLMFATSSETCSITVALVNIIREAISYQSREENDTATEVQDMGATVIDNQNTQDTAFWTERKKHTLIFLARVVAGGLPLTSITYWIIHVILANRMHILGDENIFSFGQVTPLVMLAALFYRIWDSYPGKPFDPPLIIESF